jgi:hypothetical protein
MPTAHGAEFRQGVIDVARKAGRSWRRSRRIRASVTTLKRWISIADHKESGAATTWIESTYHRRRRQRRLGKRTPSEYETINRTAPIAAYNPRVNKKRGQSPPSSSVHHRKHCTASRVRASKARLAT